MFDHLSDSRKLVRISPPFPVDGGLIAQTTGGDPEAGGVAFAGGQATAAAGTHGPVAASGAGGHGGGAGAMAGVAPAQSNCVLRP